MSELQRLNRSGLSTRHYRRAELAIRQDAALAEAEVDAIGNVTDRAMFRMAMVNRVREAAEQMAPSGAELYQMLAVAGAVGMSKVINRMGSGL